MKKYEENGQSLTLFLSQGAYVEEKLTYFLSSGRGNMRKKPFSTGKQVIGL